MTIDLFTWWAISISWSIAFLIFAGVYLYESSKKKHREDADKEKCEQTGIEEPMDRPRIKSETGVAKIAKDFTFVWILLGLLVFYIFSVKLGTGKFSELVFALGNITVEVLLVFYLFRNRDKTQLKNRKKSK